MGSNRSRTEIVSDILESAANGEGASKTKIMYTAFLSYGHLNEYLHFDRKQSFRIP